MKKISTIGEFKEIISEYKKIGKIGVVFEKNANPILIPRDDFIPTIEELKLAKTLDGLFVRQEGTYNWIMEEKVNFVFFRSIEDLGEIVKRNRMVEVDIGVVEKYMNFSRSIKVCSLRKHQENKNLLVELNVINGPFGEYVFTNEVSINRVDIKVIRAEEQFHYNSQLATLFVELNRKFHLRYIYNGKIYEGEAEDTDYVTFRTPMSIENVQYDAVCSFLLTDWGTETPVCINISKDGWSMARATKFFRNYDVIGREASEESPDGMRMIPGDEIKKLRFSNVVYGEEIKMPEEEIQAMIRKWGYKKDLKVPEKYYWAWSFNSKEEMEEAVRKETDNVKSKLHSALGRLIQKMKDDPEYDPSTSDEMA